MADTPDTPPILTAPIRRLGTLPESLWNEVLEIPRSQPGTPDAEPAFTMMKSPG
jgi:hypothetical protein